MVIIAEKSQIKVATLHTVVDTAVTVVTSKLSACISRTDEAHYVIVYRGDRLETVGQIKWAVKISKSKDSYLEANRLLTSFLRDQQDSERLLKPTIYTRTKDGSLPILNIFFNLESARRYYLNILETGKCYEHEKGAKKINLYPSSVSSLITNLNNALNNAAANGWANVSYSAES